MDQIVVHYWILITKTICNVKRNNLTIPSYNAQDSIDLICLDNIDKNMIVGKGEGDGENTYAREGDNSTKTSYIFWARGSTNQLLEFNQILEDMKWLMKTVMRKTLRLRSIINMRIRRTNLMNMMIAFSNNYKFYILNFARVFCLHSYLRVTNLIILVYLSIIHFTIYR